MNTDTVQRCNNSGEEVTRWWTQKWIWSGFSQSGVLVEGLSWTERTLIPDPPTDPETVMKTKLYCRSQTRTMESSIWSDQITLTQKGHVWECVSIYILGNKKIKIQLLHDSVFVRHRFITFISRSSLWWNKSLRSVIPNYQINQCHLISFKTNIYVQLIIFSTWQWQAE